VAVAPPPPPPPPPPPAPPPAEPEYPIVRIGMLSYLQYATDLDAPDSLNAFDVTRAYLNVNAQVSKNVRFRFTPDIRRAADGSLAGSLTVRVKYAFAQFDNLVPRGWIRFGLQQTPWLDFEESINRYRVQGTVFSEREALIPGSADFGAGSLMQLPGSYGEVHFGVYNGEGFTQTDPNRYKSIQGRLTVRPFPGKGNANGLRLSGFFNAGWYARDRPRHLGIVMGSYEHPHLVATIQGLVATENPSAQTPRDIDRRGWSVFVEPRQGPSGWAGLVRFESIDPDRSRAEDVHRRGIVGGAYWFVWPRARLGLVGTFERVKFDDPLGTRQRRLLLQTHIDF
jgi:hypothetical protein